MIRARVARLLWRLLAIFLIALGMLGVLLPGLPTVPFLLAAAWAGGHGWPALEKWLLDHPRYGESIRQWRRGGVVSRRAKWAATLTMVLSAVLLAFTPAALAVKIAVPLFMTMMAVWLWRRPEE